jgi:hypothetical protein
MNRSWTPSPLWRLAASALGKPITPIAALAARSWEIWPPESRVGPKAFFLNNQLERITGYMFCSDEPLREIHGEESVDHLPCRAHLIRDAYLVDGTLYKGRSSLHLMQRSPGLPALRVTEEIARGALYATYSGLKYFGSWLLDDVLAYPLAVAEGEPVTLDTLGPGHKAGYEAWFGMSPRRTQAAYFREVVIFDDFGQSQSRRARAQAVREALLSHVNVEPHPGVFLLRKGAGQGKPRLLVNELELAEQLEKTRGLRVVDPTEHDVPALVRLCAGARLMVGVEGSALAHGAYTIASGGSMVALQPPDRFCTVFKHVMERDERHFGFVVGYPRGDGFFIDPGELERTLDLLPPADV